MGRTLVLLGLLLAWTSAARADDRSTLPQPRSGDVVLKDFRFESGATLPSLKLHYLTLGVPRRDASGAIVDAVLLLHGTTGSAATLVEPRFEEALYAPGKPLDLASHYLVIPDGIGAGGSSKPSDGLRTRFPRYGYGDQVRSQHEMLERLGVTHLELVLGTSMGGMQTWLWAETYPQGADGFVSVAATPAAISGRNEVWRDMIVQAIRDDPDWHGGDYRVDAPPRAWLRVAMPLFAIMTTNAEAMQRQAPTRQAAIGLVDALAARGVTRDANDTLYQFDSSYDYDPAPHLDAIARPVLAIDFADDLLNPPDLLRLPTSGLVTGVEIPRGPQTDGHETLAHPEVWAAEVGAFVAKLPVQR